MGSSQKCPSLYTRWETSLSSCVFCEKKPGYEITPHCGYDDEGSQHEPPMRKCSEGTFNDGSSFYCARCRTCPQLIARPCNATTDTVCEEHRHTPRQGSTTQAAVTVTVSTFGPPQNEPQNTSTSDQGLVSSSRAQTTLQHTQLTDFVTSDSGSSVATNHIIWAAPVAVFILVSLLLLSAYIIYSKRRRGQGTVLNFNRKSSFINAGFSPLSAHPGHSDPQDVLGPNITSAPLRSVLDNLDVLEELVILLDPESHGVKGTKHLASHCDFSSTWVTYTYSMKDTKSPLKAVLEGVTSRHPDWTIGHLAKLLKQMERNDAIAVLAKLRLSEMAV